MLNCSFKELIKLPIGSQLWFELWNEYLKYEIKLSWKNFSSGASSLFRLIAKNNNVIKLYRYDADNEEKKFIKMTTIENISASIELMDFSTDNYFLIYKDSFLKITIIDLTNMKQVDGDNLEFEI